MDTPGVIFFHTSSRSYGSLLTERPESFWTQKGYLDKRPSFRDYEPPELDVAICPPPQLIIPGTAGLRFYEIVERMQEYSAKYVESELPDAKAIMLPVSSIIEADYAYAQRPETMGKTLFSEPLHADNPPRFSYGCNVYALHITGETTENIYAYSDGPYVAKIGRSYDLNSFNIHGQSINHAEKDIGGLRAIVFLKAA